jgi:hypothetical protein
MTTAPTVTAYADVLVGLIRADLAAEPERFGRVRSFTDLHDVCDANEYLIEADRITGNADPFGGVTVDDAALAAYGAFTTAAIDAAEAILWPSLHQQVHERHPTAEPLWRGQADLTSAMFSHGDGTVIVTTEHDPNEYVVGVYAPDHADGTEPLVSVYVDTVQDVLDLLADLTTLQPEGTDWSAWAEQWIRDAVDDGRLDAYLASR